MDEGLRAVVVEFNNVKELVRWLLRTIPRTRNDDKYLLLKYLEYKGVATIKDDIISIPIDRWQEVTSFETVRRVRAEIQNSDGELLPTDPNVLYERGVKEEKVKQFYGADSEKYKEYLELAYGVR